MTEHSIFYYPYASFKGEQGLLLKAAALYFDKLYILDPEKACWAGIGQNPLSDDLKLLEQENVLERIAPEDVLHKYEKIIAESVRADMKDPEFLKLCEQSGRARRWTLALAKVPKEIRDDAEFNPLDKSMQRIMGDVARELSPGLGRYMEGYAEVYDEYRETDRGLTEYRYADYPLPLGEAIMINHALIGGLLYTGATPITDEPFHNKALALKIQRAQRIPEIREILDEKAKQSELKTNRLAMTALTDLELGILPSEITMADILEYREENEGELKETRKKLGLLAGRIKEKLWTEEFSDQLEYETIPDIQENLSQAKETQDKWLKNRRVRLAVKAIGLTSVAASIGISLAISATPFLPVTVAVGALGLFGNVAIPGAEIALDWKEDKQEAMGNGLHYLLKITGR
ncbi:hypothetical protein [Candidatus Methanoperedens nitratireducens]|uniref:Uncharacterized protein n=1 Tax=Candidatus Methanoperedens nitratireducens TaxID=1392998 RepID=A0A284VK67_9EURY|nr:hypothetical protein [Candidatus Methanoperedens nitroreducens]SNQ59674.1 hypothetical protein MNV_1270004 [Candidatus Methanoperedens nitroreducens]